MNALSFSPEQYSLDGSMRGPIETLETKLAQLGSRRYLDQARERLGDDPALKQLSDMSAVIDAGFSPDNKIGEAFLSGSIVGLDVIWHYDRSLMRFMDAHITGLFEHLQQEYFRVGSSDELFSVRRQNFIDAATRYGEDGYQQHGSPYVNLIKPIADKEFHTSEQKNTVRQGLGLVLEQAMMARESDVAGLRKTVERIDDEGTDWSKMTGKWVIEIMTRQGNQTA